MRKTIALLALVLTLTSCAHFTGAQMSRIGPGMSKADVIRQLGEPKSVGGAGGVEVLHYVEDKGWWQFDYFFVRLVDGKVESYGPESKDAPVTHRSPPLRTAE
jgi:hypothetical protein